MAAKLAAIKAGENPVEATASVTGDEEHADSGEPDTSEKEKPT